MKQSSILHVSSVHLCLNLDCFIMATDTTNSTDASNKEEKDETKEDHSSDAQHLFVYATGKAGMDAVDKDKIQKL